MYAITLGIVAGIILWQVPYRLLSVMLTITLLLLLGYRRYLRAIASIFLGLLIAIGHDKLWQLKQLSPNFIAQPITITGWLVGLPRVSDSGTQFTLKIDTIAHEKVLPRLIKLFWDHPTTALYPGQRWQLSVRLKPTHGFANPGSGDTSWYDKAHGISATGYVLNNSNNEFIEIRWTIDNWRYRLAQSLEQAFPHINNLKFIKALGLGMTTDFNADDWRLLQLTGTSHLMAISGLHIGLIAGIAFFLGRLFLWCLPTLALYYPASYFSAVLALAVALFYSALAGFSLATQRALIMLSVLMLGLLLKRELGLWSSWCFALLLCTLMNPFQIVLPSFCLSFIAVAIIIASYQWYSHQRFLLRKIQVQMALSILLLPLTAWFFQQLSWLSPLTNSISIPWIGFLVVPLVLLIMLSWLIIPDVTGFLITICDFLLTCFIKLLKFFAYYSPDTTIYLGSWWVLASLVLGTVLLLMPRGIPGRSLSLFSLIPLWFHTQNPPLQAFRMTVLDVGQGLAVVVQTHGHVLVYDAGAHTMGFDAGQRIVAPFLKSYQYQKIDKLIISHRDNDHSGGVNALLQQFSVLDILSSFRQSYCHAGQQWIWDEVQFTVLWPLPYQPYQGNNSSCVVKITAGEHTALLTGDIQHDVESELIQRYPELRTDILIAPHHGSRTSSTSAFVDRLQPSIVIFSTGFYNRFHFPDQRVVQRYQAVGAHIYNTADSGAIMIETTQEKININSTRSN